MKVLTIPDYDNANKEHQTLLNLPPNTRSAKRGKSLCALAYGTPADPSTSTGHRTPISQRR